MNFFHDILILGEPSRFKEELQLLQEKNTFLMRLDKDLHPLRRARRDSFDLLKVERNAAYKSLLLAKTLLFKIKDRLDDQYVSIITDHLAHLDLLKRNSHVDLSRKERVSISFNDVGDQLVDNLTASFDFIASREKTFSFDFNSEGTKGSVDAFIAGGTALIAMNEQIRERREVVMGKIIDVTTSLKSIQPYYPVIYAESQRALEISLLLNKTNQIFIRKYEQIMKRLFSQSRIASFLDGVRGRKLPFDQEDLAALNQLVRISLEYKKLSELKVEKLWTD